MSDEKSRADERAFASAPGVTTVASSEMVCACFQAGPEVIDVEQVLAAEMRQKVVEFDMIVPPRKPEIKQVVDVYVKDVAIKSIDVLRNRVVIRGDLKTKVMYVAALPNEPVHAIEKAHIPFTRDIEVEGALPGMKATADCTVEYVDYDQSECEPRKVHVTIVLKFWTRVTTTTEMEIVALSPVDQTGVYESGSAAMAAEGMTSAAQKGQTPEAAAQMSAETAQALPPLQVEGEVVVTEPQSSAGESLSISGTTGTVTGNRVNVRTGPGTNYPSLAKVNQGDVVTIKEQAFGWYKVVLPDGNTTGWIASWFVRTNA